MRLKKNKIFLTIYIITMSTVILKPPLIISENLYPSRNPSVKIVFDP